MTASWAGAPRQILSLYGRYPLDTVRTDCYTEVAMQFIRKHCPYDTQK